MKLNWENEFTNWQNSEIEKLKKENTGLKQNLNILSNKIEAMNKLLLNSSESNSLLNDKLQCLQEECTISSSDLSNKISLVEK